MREFKFQKNVKNNLKLEFPFTEHAEELKQRISYVLLIFLVLSLCAFVNVKPIVQVLKVIVSDIKFFQLSPSEYFFFLNKNLYLLRDIINKSIFIKSTDIIY